MQTIGKGVKLSGAAGFVCGYRPPSPEEARGRQAIITIKARGVQQWDPVTKDRNYDICLDRDSFLSNGWTEAHLGRFNNGNNNERQGIFLSAFYAIQNGHPSDVQHPWRENFAAENQGLTCHVQYWVHTVNGVGLPYHMHVYDNPSAPRRRGIIVGRSSTQAPFSEYPANVIGLAGSSENIYLKTDVAWSLGKPLQAGPWVLEGTWRINATWVLAHEVGHFLGFDHVPHPACIMQPSVPNPNSPTGGWAEPDDMDQQFVSLARRL